MTNYIIITLLSFNLISIGLVVWRILFRSTLKFEDKLMSVRGTCELVIGFCAPLIAGLAQWVTGGDEPSKIAWIVILAAAISGAASKLSSFLSSAFSKYLDNRQTNLPPTPPTTNS